MSKFLVTGATGATGGATVRFLLEKGHEVRAFVHREDDRSARLAKSGAEIAIGDLHDFDSVRTAVEGTKGAYFIHPIRPGILEATAYFAQAAKEAKLEAIVNMSQISARREAKSHAARDHWIAERIFDWSGVPSTHLRPTLFAEWVLYQAKTIAGGALRVPFGTGRHAPIAAEDQARVIAAVLDNPAPHAGKIYPLYGEKEMTFAEMAAEMARILEHPVRFEKMEVEPFLAMLLGNGRKHGGDFFGQHVASIAEDHQAGIFAGTNDNVLRIGGKAPMSLDEFVRAHRSAF